MIMGDAHVEREALKKLYNTDSWREKVDKMPTAQVIAIYMKKRAERKL